MKGINIKFVNLKICYCIFALVYISASIYSNPKLSIAERCFLMQQHGIDMIHVDCNDNYETFDDIAEIRKHSNLPIDLHIISETPEVFFEKINTFNIEQVCLQYENISQESWDIILTQLNAKTNWGLAFTSQTTIGEFEKYSKNFSYAMLMCTQPGKSGGVFDPVNFQRILQFKKLFPSHKLQIDGGVNAEVSFILRNLNVHGIVSGSFLMNADNMSNAMIELKYKQVTSHFYVKEFMTPKQETPFVFLDADILQALNKVEEYKLGFVAVLDENNTLLGLLSNAEIRRSYIQYLDSGQKPTSLLSQLNKNPICINQNATVTEMLSFIKTTNKIIQYLPVIDDKNQLQGVVHFNQLIKSEL